MRYLFLLFLIPFPAQAKDITIRVNYVVKQERVQPQPMMVHAPFSLVLVLHQGGSVDESFHASGKLGLDFQHTTKLGAKRINVENAHTITRTINVHGSKRIMTITANDYTCTARVKFEGATEFKALSSDFRVMATYRNPEIESIGCKIE